MPSLLRLSKWAFKQSKCFTNTFDHYYCQGKKHVEPQSVEGDQTDKVRNKRKTKKEERAEKIATIVHPLEELPPLVKDPKLWIGVKSSFNAAIEGKLSSWYINSTEADAPLNRVEKFKMDYQETLKKEDMKALPIEEVCTMAIAAAGKIFKFKEDMKGWSMPLDLGKHRTQLELLFVEFDECVAELEVYQATVDGFEAKTELDAEKVDAAANKVVKEMKNKFYNRLCQEGHPKLVNKVSE